MRTIKSDDKSNPITSASNTRSFTRGTSEQFMNALNNKIAELSGDVNPVTSATDTDADYFESLRQEVENIITNQYKLGVTSYNEPYSLVFEVFIPDTYVELVEYVILKEDIVPNMDDLITDANELADTIISEYNLDSDLEDEYYE